MRKEFKDIGNYLIQMGLYLTTVSEDEFEEREQIKDNMINFLMQSYCYLKSYKDLPTTEDVNEIAEVTEEKYISRKDVIKIYHPLFTEYGLNQAIHTKGLPYIKRGARYFFKKSEIDEWLKLNNSINAKSGIRYV